MTVLKSRVVSGTPPTAAQVKGPQIQQWGDLGVLANLNNVAGTGDWDNLLPKVMADVMKYKGNYVAVPVNVHRINWMWANPEVFKKSGAKIPTTWEQFDTEAAKIRKAGFVPLAFDGQNWQEATVFESIVVGVGGADFYTKSLVETDPKAIDSPTMIKCFKIFKNMKQYTDRDAPGRDWNLATAMVVQGKAAMQFMGDWAKGEFTAAGKEPGVDYVALPAPETSAYFLFNIDSFIMFDVKDKDKAEAQNAMALLIMEPAFQEVFNVNKGSIPCRMGISRNAFDSVAIQSFDAFAASAATKTLLPSMAHEMAMFLAGLRGIDDSIIKATQVDGASLPRIYRRIIIPSLRPVFFSSVIILSHIAIKSFDLVVVLTRGGPGYSSDVPATFMYAFAFTCNELGLGAASAIVMFGAVMGIIIPYLYSELRTKRYA